MKTKHKTPEQYAAPLRSRKDITAFLCDRHGRQYRRGEGGHFVWNVKAGGANTDFATLARIVQEDIICRPFDSREESAFAVAYKENKDSLFYWGVEDAGHLFSDCDGFTDLWNGEPIGARFEFAGRSGGWLVLTGADQFGDLRDFDAEGAGEMEFSDLRRLYRFIVQCDADFTQENAAREVEHAAAFDLWVNHAEPELESEEREERNAAECLAICAL